MNMAPSLTLIREKAEEMKNGILSKFPGVDVEFADWVKLSGSEGSLLQARGFSFPRWGVHACMLIRGDLETAEKAATLADNEAARISEESGVEIQVQKTDHVWCKRSVPLEAHSYVPGQKLQFTSRYHKEDKRGIVFLCFFNEPHDHDFGRFSKKE